MFISNMSKLVEQENRINIKVQVKHYDVQIISDQLKHYH